MRARRWLLLAIAAACLPPDSAIGSEKLPNPINASSHHAESSLEDTVRFFIGGQATLATGRVEVSVGSMDGRLALAPCAQPEPYIPPGVRLWGRTTLGLRCNDGQRWNVMVPVHIRIYSRVLQTLRGLQPGQTLGPEDYALVEAEITREAPGVLTGIEEIATQVVARPLPAGIALRREHFRARPAAGAGDTVRVVVVGAGFSIASSGKALHGATEGQVLRVQVESGKVLSGIARSDRSVEIRY